MKVIVGGMEFTYRRGFVASVTCTAADWLAHADAILAAQPVQEVTLTTWPEWGDNRNAATASDWCKRRWPSVKTWHLPSDYQFHMDEITRHIISSFGIPAEVVRAADGCLIQCRHGQHPSARSRDLAVVADADEPGPEGFGR